MGRHGRTFSRSRWTKVVVAMACAIVVGATGSASADPQSASRAAAVARTADVYQVAMCAKPGARFRCSAQRIVNADGSERQPHDTPQGWTPADLQSAYAIDATLGAGITVAVTDMFGYSKAEADLAVYRSTFGLPPCTSASGCFKVIDQSGGPPPPDPTNDSDAAWNAQTAAELDLISAACPLCKILVVLTNHDDGLLVAQQTAATAGANVISNDWGSSEPDPAASEHYFQTTPPIGIFASASSRGYNNGGEGPLFPSTSAHVISVGNTALTKAPGTVRGWTELPLSSGGSACSTQIPKPGYQASIISDTVCKYRAACDVAADSTNLAMYYKGGWVVGGGIASPLAAAIFAMTGNALAGPSFPYANPSAFWDILGSASNQNGSCGAPLCIAGSGWDGPTGIGTPNGTVLAQIGSRPSPAPDMAGTPDMAATPVPPGTPDMADMAVTPITPVTPDMAVTRGGGTGSVSGGCSLGSAQSGSGALALLLLPALVALVQYRRRRGRPRSIGVNDSRLG
jgi:hypothetical protein